MRRGMIVWLGVVVLLAGAGMANARAERELSDDELRVEMAQNRALAAYVARNGDPDLAETHFLADVPPWDDHEVTVYYFDMHKEIGFARAYILDRPTIQIQRYERPLTDQQIAALSTRAHKRPSSMGGGSMGGGPDERAEDAARRAEAAADRIDAAAESAERAADKAEAIGNQADAEFKRSLRK